MPATTQNSGRQACDPACSPPMNGPRATAPKMHMFMITAVVRKRARGKPMASGGTAAMSSMLVAIPCRMWPAKYMPAFCAEAREHRTDNQRDRVDQQHPALGQVLGELDGQHGAQRVGGVAQPGAEAERSAHSCAAARR